MCHRWPVLQPARVELVINRVIVKALDLEVRESSLLRATRTMSRSENYGRLDQLAPECLAHLGPADLAELAQVATLP
jgi:hypothetical protein